MLPATKDFSVFINDVASKNATTMKYYTIVVRAIDVAIPFKLKCDLNLNLGLKSPYSNSNIDYWLHFNDFMTRELNQHISTGWYDPSNWNASHGIYSSSNLTVYADSWCSEGEHRAGFCFCPNDPSWTPSKIKELVKPIVEKFTSVELVNIRATSVTPRQLRKPPKKKTYEGITDSKGIILDKGDIVAYSRVSGQTAITKLGVLTSWTAANATMADGSKSPLNKVIIIRSSHNKKLSVDDFLEDAEKYTEYNYF